MRVPKLLGFGENLVRNRGRREGHSLRSRTIGRRRLTASMGRVAPPAPDGCAHLPRLTSESGCCFAQRVAAGGGHWCAPSSREMARAASVTAVVRALAGVRGIMRSVSPKTPIAPTARPE